MERIHQRYAGDVAFLGVSLDEYESTAKSLAESFGLSFPVVHDKGSIRGRYRVQVLPATFVIDRAGAIAWVKLGGEGWDEEGFTRVLDSVLAESPPAPAMPNPR